LKGLVEGLTSDFCGLKSLENPNGLLVDFQKHKPLRFNQINFIYLIRIVDYSSTVDSTFAGQL
jgi:hypothetical protein